MKKFILTGLIIALATVMQAQTIKTGAESLDEYLPLLKGKRVAVLSNQTGIIGKHPYCGFSGFPQSEHRCNNVS